MVCSLLSYAQYLKFYMQQLAVLLITRQLIRNIKESALPYVLEQIRFAKISFDLFGALTPSDGPAKPNGERVVSQPELECSMFKVRVYVAIPLVQYSLKFTT